MSNIDWSKAGTRLRRTPPTRDQRNPDWNFPAQRWKDEADYAAEALSVIEVRHYADCSNCGAIRGFVCRTLQGVDMRDDVCTPRRLAAGKRALEIKETTDA